MTNTQTDLMLRSGYIPLPMWIIGSAVAGMVATDYSPIASHVSVMTLQDGPAHLLTNLTAITIGVSLIVFGGACWKISERKISLGAVCWIGFGISMITNGIWPMGGPMHGLYIIGILNILAPLATLLDIRGEELRRKLHGFTGFVSLASLFYLWLLLNGFDPQNYSGLTQRLFASITYAWPFIFVFHFLKLSNGKNINANDSLEKHS